MKLALIFTIVHRFLLSIDTSFISYNCDFFYFIIKMQNGTYSVFVVFTGATTSKGLKIGTTV